MKKVNWVYIFLFLIGISFVINSCSEHSYESECLKKVKRLTDQIKLAEFALESDFESVELAAVKKLTDQSLLSMIAVKHRNSNVRLHAIGKLKNQTTIANIASEDRDADVRLLALTMLTDQIPLEKIANEDCNVKVRISAINMLKDESIIERLAIEDFNEKIREAATKMLTDSTVLAEIDAVEDKRVQSIKKIKNSLISVPQWRQEGIIKSLLPAINILNNPLVYNYTGKIISVKTNWSFRKATYVGDISGSMKGEIFGISIKLQNFSRSLSHTWTNVFENEISYVDYKGDKNLGFQSADINIVDILEPVFKILPQNVLTNIGLHCEDEKIGLAATKILTDQSALAKLAIWSENYEIRRLSINKLSDESVLIKIAMVDNVPSDIFDSIINKLTNRSYLSKIAKEHYLYNYRLEAQKRLDNL